jgi:branched-chain amino acid transport system permease protein
MKATLNETPSVEPVAYAGLSPTMWRYAGIAAILAIACILPFAVSGYRVSQFSQVLIYAIAMLGLNILTGFNGQISLSQGAFYAIGAYTTAILLDKTAIPYWATVPIAGAICLGAGFLFGLPALRLEGLYLALATFALAVAIPQILKFKGFDQCTGGVQGIQVDPPAAPFGLPLNTDRWIYYFCLIWTIALLIIVRNLLRGRTGRAIIAIRDHPLAAATMGVDTALYKSLTFGVSAMYTGIAGALGALLSAYVSPDSFPVLLSIKFLSDSDGCAKGSLGLCLMGTDSRKKHAAEPVQFGRQPLFPSFDHCFCLPCRLKRFGGTTCEVQSFGPQHLGPTRSQAGCAKLLYSVIDRRDPCSDVTGSAARPTAERGSCRQKIRKMVTR